MHRNPSPPPDIPDDVLRAGELGETGYSQQWLFKLLSQLIETVENEGDSSDPEGCEDELEEDLCQLWDLSLDTDVMKILHEYKLPTIVTGIIQKSKQARITEICIGILANIACHEAVCQEISEKEEARDVIAATLGCRDTGVLTETCRLLRVLLSNEQSKSHWREVLSRSSMAARDNVNFILKSSTAGPLLLQALHLLEVILEEEGDLGREWCQSSVLEASIEGYSELKKNDERDESAFFGILYCFSASQEGVVALVSQFDAYYPFIAEYVADISDDEAHLLSLDSHAREIRSLVPVLDVILNAIPPQEVIELIEQDSHLFVNLLRIAQACLSHRSCKSSDGILRDLSIYFQDLVLLTMQVGNAKWPRQLDTQTSTRALKSFFTCLSSAGDRLKLLKTLCRKLGLVYLQEELQNYESNASI